MKGKDETKEHLLYLAAKSSFGDLETNTFNNVKMGENISEACRGRTVNIVVETHISSLLS